MLTPEAPALNIAEIDADRVDLRAWYVLGLLTFAYALAYIDRQMLNLLVDPIKHTLAVSDTQFSLIQGTAFVSAYLIAVPVFGRLVDLVNRRNILIFGVCTWSTCTVLCGRSDTYMELFAARFGVGVSEACVVPVAWSLIADYFTPRRTSRAMSIFSIGVQLGGGFSLVASGLVIAFSGSLIARFASLASLQTWQVAFVVIGLPGFLFAVLLLTVREPARRKILRTDTSDEHHTIQEVIAALWARRRFYARIYFGIGMIGIVQLGVPAWMPSFLIRAYGMPPSRTGFSIGVLLVVFGPLGILLGPAVARWLQRLGYEDAPLRTAAFGTLGMLISCAAIPLSPSGTGALTAAACVIFWNGFPIGCIAGATQIVTPSRVRGVVASLYTFFAQLIGYGIGPTAVALVTDKVFGDPKLVGYSLQIVTCAASLVAALLFFTVLRPYRELLKEGAVIPAIAAK